MRAMAVDIHTHNREDCVFVSYVPERKREIDDQDNLIHTCSTYAK